MEGHIKLGYRGSQNRAMLTTCRNDFGTWHDREGCVTVHTEAESHKSRMRQASFCEIKSFLFVVVVLLCVFLNLPPKDTNAQLKLMVVGKPWVDHKNKYALLLSCSLDFSMHLSKVTFFLIQRMHLKCPVGKQKGKIW